MDQAKVDLIRVGTLGWPLPTLILHPLQIFFFFSWKALPQYITGTHQISFLGSVSKESELRQTVWAPEVMRTLYLQINYIICGHRTKKKMEFLKWNHFREFSSSNAKFKSRLEYYNTIWFSFKKIYIYYVTRRKFWKKQPVTMWAVVFFWCWH